MQRIVPCIWFDHTAQEAAQFYIDVFEDGHLGEVQYYPERDLPEFQKEFAGKPVTIDVVIRGFRITGINAGPEVKPNPAISFMVHFDASEESLLDQIWNGLGNGGQVLMPLDAYPFSPRYGWVQDRYGVNWQLMLGETNAPERPFIVPSLMFTEEVLGRASEAIDFYTGLFDGTVMAMDRYAEKSGIAAEGAVTYAAFTMLEEQFVAMDTSVEHGFTFTPGLSFVVLCRDQDEIDRYWEALSAVPEAEQCGWCVDQFGVSWHIIPADWAHHLAKPGAYQEMLRMKKIEIARFG